MKRVLIADDRAASRELIRTVLETLGLEIVEAADGIEALRLARDRTPDLIVLDIHMPGVDGFGVLKELRQEERFARVPIMALTASAMQGDRERAIAAGFNAYVCKPIPLTALRSEVERLIGEGAKS